MKATGIDHLFTDGTNGTVRRSGQDMKQEGTMDLFQYWNRLRKGRPAPRRTEVEPADIRKLLADTFILEKDARGEAIFRLAGTRLCAAFGRELKGFAFTSLWRQKDQKLIARLAEGAFLARSVAVLLFEGWTREERRLEFELLLLPLDGGQDQRRAMGSIIALERPYWLGNDAILDCRMISVRAIDPDREAMFLANRPAIVAPPSLSPSQSDFAVLPSRTAGGRRIRHLVVYEGGKDE